tara:strand:+ start:1101 stop:1514 length:414 start_codon:yes stop_codon:yes gene_type:complete
MSNIGRQIQPTGFELKWGIHAKDLAIAEGTTPDAIHMRVKRFGTPYMRRAKPTACEIMTGYSKHHIATTLGLHYNYIALCLTTRSSADKIYSKMNAPGVLDQLVNRLDMNSWIMPQHPDYNTWRHKFVISAMESYYA